MKSPLLHIAILAVLVALAILIVQGPPTADAEKRVVIQGLDLLQLRAGLQRTWQREPTPTELRGALEQHIRQEVLYREALARGYDRDDLTVRRAMQQKMEFLAQSQAQQKPPSDEEIAAFFNLRRERYRLPAVFSLIQLFLDPEKHGPDFEGIAAERLEQLRREQPQREELLALSDSTLLEAMHTEVSEEQVARTFGQEFAAQLLELPPGEWSGPIRSGYGLHLVLVLEKVDGRVPDWSEVAPKVLMDMEYEASQASKEQLYQEVAQSYQVVFDPAVREFLESASE